MLSFVWHFISYEKISVHFFQMSLSPIKWFLSSLALCENLKLCWPRGTLKYYHFDDLLWWSMRQQMHKARKYTHYPFVVRLMVCSLLHEIKKEIHIQLSKMRCIWFKWYGKAVIRTVSQWIPRWPALHYHGQTGKLFRYGISDIFLFHLIFSSLDLSSHSKLATPIAVLMKAILYLFLANECKTVWDPAALLAVLLG